ncbi:MAG: 50S ribosomal protein L13 [Chloroflexi bacterium]|nr:50S ribosomal protein L13 [Chloroflexota bacterium]
MTTKTYRLRASDIERKWHVLDASGRPLGRIASEAAHLLLGKHKPTYEPHLAMGDHVIVVNAAEVILTGNKASQKTYYRHSGYPGNLRARSFAQQMERDARKVIETAVRGMLPHNVRGRELFRHLKVYNGPEHPHEAQVNAGTGARARKRAAAEERAAAVAEAAPEVEEPTVDAVEEPVAEAPAVEAIEETATEAAPERLTGSLSRYRRGELDIEAERLGIIIEDGWRKGDVVEAIAAYYDANPLDEDE